MNINFPEYPIFCAGVPAPKGSTRAFLRKGKPVITADNERTKPWQNVITTLCFGRRAYAGSPVAVSLTFLVPRPKGHYSNGKLKPSAPTFPTTKPDIDKLTRAVLDALTDAQWWEDDSRVVNVIALKLYADDHPPGVWVNATVLQRIEYVSTHSTSGKEQN